MRAFRPIVTALVALTGAGLAWSWLREPTAAPRTIAPAPVPVVTATVRQGDVPILLRGLGTVAAFNVATIRSQVTGYLESVTFTEGQHVEKGDVLAQVDQRVFQARLDEAKGKLQTDEAQVANVETNLGRNEPLLKQGFATDLEVTGQKAKVAELKSTLETDKAAVAYAQTELDYATLRAPFAGVTGIRLIDVGNLVRPTDPGGVVVLTQMQPISVIFTVPSAEIPALQAAFAHGPVPATVFDQAGERQLDAGTLLLIDNQAQVRSGTVQLKANFPNARRQLWPGTFVVAEVTTSVVANALTVPTDALQQNDHGPYVFVVGPDRRVAIRAVEVSQRVRATALISKGLRPGETVVVQGQYRLASGAEVAEAGPEDVSRTSAGSVGLLP